MMTTQDFGILNINMSGKEKREGININMNATTTTEMVVGVRGGGGGGGGAMPQPATTRWNPTAEQLMILEDMYRGGIRTPNAQEIQQITAHLSLYGKIEGKNVFYWFQNHKARDRQKLRRTHNIDTTPTTQQHRSNNSTPITTTFSQGTTLSLNLNNGWLYGSDESTEDCFKSVEEYGWEMNSRSATTKPLKTLDLFPTYSGL